MADKPKKLNANVVAETYARALFQLAEERNVFDEVSDELNQIVQLLHDHPNLNAVFSHPLIKSGRRAETLTRIFQGRISDTTYHFLMILNNKSRLDQVLGVQVAFNRLLKAKRGEIDVELQTARELDPAQLEQVGARISSAIGCKAILDSVTDTALIGGMKIRIGDKLIDASVSTQLRRMKDEIVKRAHELAANAARD